MKGYSYFSGKVLGGILKLHFKRDWEKFLADNNEQEIELFARPYKKQRTLNQNDYYWKLLEILYLRRLFHKDYKIDWLLN